MIDKANAVHQPNYVGKCADG